MNHGLRLSLLGLLAASTVGVMWVVGHRATPQQPLSLRPVLDRATEAKAASVLGHEMAHCDLGHCIGRYQYELQAKKAGGDPLGAMASLGAVLMLQGYRDEWERPDEFAQGRLGAVTK